MVAELIGWIFGIMLMSWHMQCSTLAEHRSECANVSHKEYFKERIQKNESNFHYYKESEVESLQNLLEDNIAVVFCAEVTMQQKVIQIANRTNVALYGRLGGHTEIHCSLNGNESAGYRFMNVTNLTLSNISFINCGILNPVIDEATQLQGTTPSLSAVWIHFCENVTLSNIKVRNSIGTGIVLFDTIGRVKIIDSLFETTNFHNKYNFSYGIYVKFRSDNVREDEAYENCNRSCTFVFHNDSFINNSVPSYHNQRVYSLYRKDLNQRFGLGGGLTFQFEDNGSWYKVINITNCTFRLNAGHHGGGMSFNFTNSTSRNTITITQCNFTNNTGDFGGGLSLVFSDSPHNNFVLLANVEFSKNCAKMGGGAMELGFHFQQKKYPEPNVVTLKNCTVVENKAQYGGGTVLHYSRAKFGTQNYVIEFINSTWERNKAVFGAAVQASIHVSDKLTSGYTTSPVFQDCKFMSNNRTEETFDVNRSKDEIARLSWGKCVFFTTALPIRFKGNTLFYGSNATALCLSSSIVEFAAGSNVNFTKNKGFEGGAINLYGLSEVHVSDNSSFLFYENIALSKGGAIIYRSGNKLDLVSSTRCFIRYVGNTTTVEKRSITLEFKNNSARALRNNKSYGHTIYATTLIPCRRACAKQGGLNNYSDIQFGCIGNVIIRNNRSHEVSTDGAIFSVSNESNKMTAIPGKEFKLKLKLLDENNEEAYNPYRIIIAPWSNETSIKIDPTYSFINDKTIKLYGEPGHKGQIIIGTNNFRDIAVGLNVEMEQCPPGFVAIEDIKKGIECVCSASIVDKTYLGILQCELHSYQAYLIHGYWIGYDSEKGSESTLKSGYCPRGFCTRKKANETEILLPIKPSRDAVNDVVCGEYRQGKLCGSCSSNMSVYYHSHSYYCRHNDRCRLGPLLYFVSEIIPVTILFMVVLFFNVKLTSGALNGFIFFIQFIDTMLIDANGYISTHDVLDTFMSIYLFTYRMFNLNFFTIDKFSFCLWQGANTLDIFSFKYVTILYSVTLVVITVLLKKCGKGKYLVLHRRQNLRGSESSRSSVKSTMIHGFSAFFVMCYSQCAKVTLFILTPGYIRSLGQFRTNITPVVFYHGDFEYFGHDHIKYAIPALMFAIALVLIPPLLLVVYPLCYKVLALLHIEETRCVNILCRILPLERMKPMFDSFQSCFKDKYRFFAGLYFFYRLVALLSFLITDSLTKFYIALEVQLIVMLTLQAITYPYRRRWHNIIDVLLFANLAVINAMTMYNYKKSKERNLDTRSINAVVAIQTILVSTPLVCMVCFVIMQLALRVKRARRRSEGECRDDRTDTVLALVDYREMEESKSLEY